jgi:putative oxidoreductase
MSSRVLSSTAPASVILTRLIVGWVFLSEEIQKFLFPGALGVGRFTQVGIPDPQIMAPFVGVVEILFGALLILGLFTRLATIPLLIIISVAIWATKIPVLTKQDFGAMAHEGRSDFCMVLGLIFVLILGAGRLSLDLRLQRTTAR